MPLEYASTDIGTVHLKNDIRDQGQMMVRSRLKRLASATGVCIHRKWHGTSEKQHRWSSQGQIKVKEVVSMRNTVISLLHEN